MLQLIPASSHAQSDDEKKAIAEIERKAEEEKKKAIEKLKKKREEAEKKKAEADKKKAEREQKKAEADAKKQAERDKKKAEEERKKAEKEGRKPPETVAELPPQPPRPPPPAPPAAEPLPDAKPVDRAGDARWTGVGFVQAGEAAPADPATASAGVKVPSTLGALGMNRGHFLFGMGVARFNPINDDVTDDDTAFNMANPSLRVGYEWRNLGSLLAPWFDASMGMAFGSRKHVPPGTTASDPFEFSVFALLMGGRFGIDLAPIDLLSAGPYAGYRFELINVKWAREADSPTACSADAGYTGPGETCSGINHGLEYGLHARFRTRAPPGEAERFYLDAIYGWRKGEFQTTSNIELEAGIRAGEIFFVGWYQKRLGSSGRFEPADVQGDNGFHVGKAAAASMPVDQRLGGGIALIF